MLCESLFTASITASRIILYGDFPSWGTVLPDEAMPRAGGGKIGHFRIWYLILYQYLFHEMIVFSTRSRTRAFTRQKSFVWFTYEIRKINNDFAAYISRWIRYVISFFCEKHLYWYTWFCVFISCLFENSAYHGSIVIYRYIYGFSPFRARYASSLRWKCAMPGADTGFSRRWRPSAKCSPLSYDARCEFQPATHEDEIPHRRTPRLPRLIMPRLFLLMA